jgi:hypothetical protein
MDTRHVPALTWIAVPGQGAGISRATGVSNSPFCDRADRSARQRCARSPRVFETGPPLLEPGEVVILFVTIDPMPASMLEDRIRQIGPGTPMMRMPALVMEGRTDLWAAYLVRR